ncbi:rhamnan synthesis F family protein [Enterococcus sp. LJL99]
MKDLVSVIVTCYNHEAYIAQCLNSIFTQTYNNIELLIINDGSTDHSGDIIEELISSSPFENTEYISQVNSGICVTRNRGLEWASGEFLLFVDSDNYLDDDFIEKLVYTANTSQADIVYTDLFNIETQEIFMEAKPFTLKTYLASNYIDNCSLLRKEKINSYTYDLELNRKKLVDYDFIMGLILLNQAIPTKCEGAKLNYRVLANSISREGDHATEKYYYEVYLYILKKYVKNYPYEILAAVQENIMTLSARLTDLIQHLSNLEVHINNQESTIQELLQQSESLQKEIEYIKNKENQLLKEKQNLTNENKHLKNVISLLENDKNEILSSASFRIGNFVIKPLSYCKKVIKNPKIFFLTLRKVKNYLSRKITNIPSVKKVYFKQKRRIQRKNNNYNNPRRMLIFVIYEGQDQLQEYKLYFLKSLAKFVDNVLIVVNGQLPDSDIQNLSKIGHVEIRDNSGYDTAAFRYGINYLGKSGLNDYDELLLVNDTNVGPIEDLSIAFSKMNQKEVDFWGISYGEEQNDFTEFNKYGYIPIHLQSYFLVIEKSLLVSDDFYDYWTALNDTDSRYKAIGKHETVFTKHFEDLGFTHSALIEDNIDSPMYIHPLRMVKDGSPLIKYTAFANYTNEKFAWQGLSRETEVPALIEYLKTETDYPMSIIDQIMFEVKNKKVKQHILIIDGVENVIPQLTNYRVMNKKEQLESLGYAVWVVNLSTFQMGYAEHASHIIIYRAPLNSQLIELVRLARSNHKPIFYDIDDLVIDTAFTDQLSYVQQLSETEKRNYDNGVISYGDMMELCDGVVTSTLKMKEELHKYKDLVLLNRNLANHELVKISQRTEKQYNVEGTSVKIGYFSGSITHNENFELVKQAIIQLMKKYNHVELHLVGHLDLPDDIKPYKDRIKIHPFVNWQELPQLISEVDINIAPLVNSIFNEAKSEIKWIEASLVKVPTVASNLGAFKEMITNNETGVLVNDSDWYDSLDTMIQSFELRKKIAENANKFILEQAITIEHEDELTKFLRG